MNVTSKLHPWMKLESTHIKFCCPQCQYETTSEESLHQHAQTHETVMHSQSQLKCPKCDFKTEERVLFRTHLENRDILILH